MDEFDGLISNPAGCEHNAISSVAGRDSRGALVDMSIGNPQTTGSTSICFELWYPSLALHYSSKD